MQIKPSLLLFLFITCFSISSIAQKVKRKGVTPTQVNNKKTPVAKYTMGQLTGKWQEIKRIPAGTKDPIDFTDTLLMNFYDDKVELKDATSMRMSMKGDAQIEAPATLVVAGDYYEIRTLDKSTLIIEDDEFIRELQQKEQFYYETLGKIKIPEDSITVLVNTDINNLKGKWLVYSRKAPPGATNSETPIIRSINITSVSPEGIAYGDITFYISDVTKTSQCQLVTKDGIVKIAGDKDTWSFFVYKADGKEFVFGEAGKLVYYSKH